MNKSTKKKKIEFSKIITLIAIIIFTSVAIWSLIEYYTLIRYAIENNSSIVPDSVLPVTCITTILGAILSYCLYQGALKSSLNKNKLTVDKITGEVKNIMENNFIDAIKENKEFEESEEVDNADEI